MELVESKVNWKGETAVKYIHGRFRAASFILVAFALENVANIHLTVNLVTYFSGVLHMDSAEAANALTSFMGTGYILPILFAIFADTNIGRFKTIIVSGFIEFLGMVLLTVQAHYSSLRPPPCDVFDPTSRCEKLNGGQNVFLNVALYLVAAGMAGIKAGVPSHGADQFDGKDHREAKQMPSFFNGLLFVVCIGGAISLALFVWLDVHKGWDVGFGASTIAMFLALVVAVLGWPLYRIHVTEGTSAIVEIIQVFVAAFRNRNLQLPDNPLDLYEIERDKEAGLVSEDDFLPHRNVFRFLDKAAIRTASQTPNPWKLCTVTQVENAKIIFRMFPVFTCAIIMTLCLAQLQTFSVQQGLTMDTQVFGSFHISPASLPIIPIIFMIIVVPIYDQIIVPMLRKFTGHLTGITHLKRIGVGLFLSSVSMGTAAIIETRRKSVAQNHNMLDALPVFQPLPISVFWLSFQYFIFGIADMFTYVGLLEFFYSEFPKKLKTVSTCFLWTSMSLGYFLSSILVRIVNRFTADHTGGAGWLTVSRSYEYRSESKNGPQTEAN
ncbi:hypothetical protein V6N13_033690 [Hibiscus sabdariffa]